MSDALFQYATLIVLHEEELCRGWSLPEWILFYKELAIGQLNSFELLSIIGLGSILGDPMIYTKELSIPQAIIAMVRVVVLFKGIDYLTARSKRFTRLVVAEPVQLVKDGKYIARGLRKARISENEFKSLME